MREIVADALEQQLAISRGEAALVDLDLYNSLFQKFYLSAFHDFCLANRLYRSASSEGFDSQSYVREQLARRKALNLFIRQKPPVVVHCDRFFIITFLSELDIQIVELSAEEVADTVGVKLKTRGVIARIGDWLELRRLRGRVALPAALAT